MRDIDDRIVTFTKLQDNLKFIIKFNFVNWVIKFLGIKFPDSELFLVEALEEIERRRFQNGSPVINMAALVNEEFVVAGEVMASLIAQGGPAPNIMNVFIFIYCLWCSEC